MDTNIWQMQVQVEWGELAHTCLFHLTNAPFSMSSFSEGKKFEAVHLNEVLLSFCASLADHSPLQLLGCYYANEKEARSHAPVFAPVFNIPIKS